MTSKEYIESGILEQYVFGTASPAECAEVERRAAEEFAIRQEIAAICETLEAHALENAITPNPVVRVFVMASIDYEERLKKGEPITNPPLLNEKSTLADYAPWLNRSDMVSSGTEDMFAKIIGYTPAALTAIVWLKEYAPQEVHDTEHEHFFIVEGTCDIVVGDKVHHLVPGDYFAIPLYENHYVTVTSSIACKIILQRVAA
jgi:mannose-6-phosphate isomerase-like protein (cupin superfamily)